MARTETPDFVPVLSKGKHRRPSKGGCFMEYASFLAGEKWSDHPECTHALLAELARGVNDNMSDAGRSRIVGLIPSVVGLNSDDPLVDMGIAVRSATLAIPVAAETHQRALAVGILTAMAAFESETPVSAVDTTELFDSAGDALARAPRAGEWARGFIVDVDITPRAFRRRSAPGIVRVAVKGIAEACISDPDSLLEELLETAIRDCTRWLDAGMPTREAGSGSLGARLDVSRETTPLTRS